MFYLCLLITVFSPLGFAQDETNCGSPTPLLNFWWLRKETYAIELDNNRQMIPYINNSIPFVFLIPGIGESIISPSINEIIHAYFDYNGTTPTIIEADYSGGRLPSPLYLPPAGECGYLKIAVKVTEFLYILNATYNFQIECMHVIGVSFGVHIAGTVGNLLKEKYNYTLGRITGLGPLGTEYYCETCQSLRLNKGDAKFVDIIHTNPVGILQPRSVGDIDFYVNWPFYRSSNTDFIYEDNIEHGLLRDPERRDSNLYHDWPRWIQPGCDNASDPGDMILCSSLRSAALYAESIRYQNFRATSCHSFIRFTNCFPTDYTYMGLYAKPSRNGVYYVETNSNPPYGMGPPGPTPEGIGPCSCVEIGCRTTIPGRLTIY